MKSEQTKEFSCTCNYDAKCPHCGSNFWLKMRDYGDGIAEYSDRELIVLAQSDSATREQFDECLNCGAVVS